MAATLQLQCVVFSLQWLPLGWFLLCWRTGFRAHGLSSCGSQACNLPRGLWNLSRPGIEPRFPALVRGLKPLDHQESPREVIFEDAYQNAQLELFLSHLGQPVKRDSPFSRRDRTQKQTCKHPDIMQAMKIKDFLPF